MIDLRAIRVGLEIEGQMRYYQALDGMQIRVSGTKSANAEQNDCKVTISGLNRTSRDYLLTQCSPLLKGKKHVRMVVEAGRVSTGLSQVFAGDIVTASPSPPPDVDIELTAKTGAGAASLAVSRSSGARAKLSEIAAQVARDIKATLDFQATDKQISSYTYTGGAMGQVSRLASAGGVRTFLDDGVLLVQDKAKATKGRVTVLNMNSGLVGIPKVTEKGVEVTYLFDGAPTLGGMLRLDSRFNPAANGDYKIDQIKFDLASHDDPFFYIATCTPL